MSLRQTVRQLRTRIAGTQRTIPLVDGTTHRIDDRNPVWFQLLAHRSACMMADYRREPRPPASEIVRAACRARDRRRALALICDYPNSRFLCGYDAHAIAERGELVHLPFAEGCPPVAPLPEDGGV